MKNLNWDKIKVFYYIAREKNISHAAKLLNVTHSTASRQLKELEEDFGKNLVIRHQRGVALTEYGKNIFLLSQEIHGKFQGLEISSQKKNERPSGTLRVISDFGFVDTWLGERLHEYAMQYPEVYIEVKARHSLERVQVEDFDVAITTQLFDEPGMIVKKFKQWNRKLFASEGYIKQRGLPESIKDLDSHDLIGFGDKNFFPDENMDWHLSIGRTGIIRKPRISVNSMRSLVSLAKSGMGIISFSEESDLIKNNDLINVLPKIYGPTIDSYIVTMNFLDESPTIKTFVNFLCSRA